MTTVVDFSVRGNFSPLVADFYEQVWWGLARFLPEEKFVFLVEKQGLEVPSLSNISYQPMKRSSFSWLDKKRLMKVLNEEKAANYITLQEHQWNIVRPSGEKISRPSIATPAVRLFFSEYHKQEAATLNNPTRLMRVIQPALQPVTFSFSWSVVESIKTSYTGGRDFFLFTGDINEQHHLLELLKAFSLFKKWQQSNMQLVIAGYQTPWTEFLEERLATYKYQSDVVLLKDIPEEETVKLTGAAYALLYPSEKNVLPSAMLRALESGVAIIASDIPVNREITSNAEWVNNNNLQEDLANAMKLLYKDENYKQQLVLRMKEERVSNKWENMLQEIGQILKQN